jgi:Cu-Zn family superoxide dismutase
MRALAIGVGVGLALAGTTHGQELRAEMYLITPEAMNKPIDLVLITSTEAGAKFVANLQGLPPGQHGFHVYENGDRGPGPADEGTSAAGTAASRHYDPERTGGASWAGGPGASG